MQRTSHFRTVKSSNIPQSIFDLSFDTQSANGDDSNSIISSTFLSFDEEIVNSHTNRRTLAKANSDNNNEGLSQSAVSREKVDSTAADETLGSTLDPIIENMRSLAITKTPITSPKPSTPSSNIKTNQQTFTENTARALKINEEKVRCVSQTDMDCQIILREILSEEKIYLKELEDLLHDLSKLLKLSDARRKELGLWGLNMEHLMSLFHTCEHIHRVNQNHLYYSLNSQQLSHGSPFTAIVNIFRSWLTNASGLYVKYASHSPHGNLLMLRIEKDSIISEMSRINHAWLYYLRRPLRRIESYDSYIRRILELSESSNQSHEFGGIKQMFDRVKRQVEAYCLVILPVSKNVYLEKKTWA